jgi:hypothetical protein
MRRFKICTVRAGTAREMRITQGLRRASTRNTAAQPAGSHRPAQEGRKAAAHAGRGRGRCGGGAHIGEEQAWPPVPGPAAVLSPFLDQGPDLGDWRPAPTPAAVLSPFIHHGPEPHVREAVPQDTVRVKETDAALAACQPLSALIAER